MTTNTLRFTKMHGLGNDFIVINAMEQAFDDKHMPILQLADRHIGIGFDQLLIIEPAKNADVFCRIFNADGSESEQCGNGLRCVARYLHEEKLLSDAYVSIETIAGIFPITIKDYNHITIAMGAPHIQDALISLAVANHGTPIPVSTLSIGNPHAVTKVDSIDTVAAEQLGIAISSNAYFPDGANVGFMEIINPNQIRLRTFERGAGETHACGSNACAAVVAGMVNGWLQNHVNVEFRYGSLLIEWDGDDKPIYMTGPATRVFEGEVLIAQF